MFSLRSDLLKIALLFLMASVTELRNFLHAIPSTAIPLLFAFLRRKSRFLILDLISVVKHGQSRPLSTFFVS